jgi:hypothetical protein
MTGPQTLLRCAAVLMLLAATVTTPVLAATGPGEAEHYGLVAGGVVLAFAILFRRRFRSKNRRTIRIFTE